MCKAGKVEEEEEEEEKMVGGSALFVTSFYTKPRKRDRSKKGF